MSASEDERMVTEVRSYAASLSGAGGAFEGLPRDAIAEAVRRFARSGHEQHRLAGLVTQRYAKLIPDLDDENFDMSALERQAATEWLATA